MTTIDLTLQEIESLLREREVIMTVDNVDGVWCVWVYDPSAPQDGVAVGYEGMISNAIREAISAWDRGPGANR